MDIKLIIRLTGRVIPLWLEGDFDILELISGRLSDDFLNIINHSCDSFFLENSEMRHLDLDYVRSDLKSQLPKLSYISQARRPYTHILNIEFDFVNFERKIDSQIGLRLAETMEFALRKSGESRNLAVINGKFIFATKVLDTFSLVLSSPDLKVGSKGSFTFFSFPKKYSLSYVLGELVEFINKFDRNDWTYSNYHECINSALSSLALVSEKTELNHSSNFGSAHQFRIPRSMDKPINLSSISLFSLVSGVSKVRQVFRLVNIDTPPIQKTQAA